MRRPSQKFAAVTIGLCGMLSNGWAADTGETIVQGVPGKMTACATCHGAHGEGGGDGVFPRVAGLPAAYIETQLKAFRDGGRREPVDVPHGHGADRSRHQRHRDLSRAPATAVSRAAQGGAVSADAGAEPGHSRTLGARSPGLHELSRRGFAGRRTGDPGLAGQSSQYLSAQLRGRIRSGQRAPRSGRTDAAVSHAG